MRTVSFKVMLYQVFASVTPTHLYTTFDLTESSSQHQIELCETVHVSLVVGTQSTSPEQSQGAMYFVLQSPTSKTTMSVVHPVVSS